MSIELNLAGQDFSPETDEIFIHSLNSATERFIKKIRNSFTNKMVSLANVDHKYFFEHAVFEEIQGNNLKLVSMATRRALTRVAEGAPPDYVKNIEKYADEIPLDDTKNISAHILRKATIQVAEQKNPDIEFINLDQRDLIPVGIQKFLRHFMHEAVGLPIFAGNVPLGILWGISFHRYSRSDIKNLSEQLLSLFTAISTSISSELQEEEPDPVATKRFIEHADTASRVISVYHTSYSGQARPVRTTVSHSHYYKIDYRTDSSYILPTSKGYAVSLKRFQPKKPLTNKRILLMVPGFFCNRTLMDRLAREMSLKYGYIVFTMDFRGRSRSTTPPRSLFGEGWTVDDYIWEDFPVALDWITRQYPGARVVVFGHSMGGMIPCVYTGAYNKMKLKGKYKILPNPRKYLEGIVTITSPAYINISPDIPGFSLLAQGGRLLGQTNITHSLLNLVSSAISTALPTIGLQEFFNYIHGIGGPFARDLSFNITTKWLTLRNFVGYKQITPPEWYLLLEDTFCKESVKTVNQFLKSQLSDSQYYSYDGDINYTEEQKNITLPLFTVLGTEDRIATPGTVEKGFSLVSSNNKMLKEYAQGHLGIILHPPTVKQIAADTHKWMKSI